MNYVKSKVVMLPSEKSKYSLLDDKVMCINSIERPYSEIPSIGGNSTCKPQHLYFLSDEEIKKGDWIIDSTGELRQVLNINREDRLSLSGIFALTILASSCKKIIATTNSDITGEYYCTTTSLEEDMNCPCLKIEGNKCVFKPLPRPSNNFIQKFVEQYNKGNVITEVLIEYEAYVETGGYAILGVSSEWVNNPTNWKWQLKIAPDNTITIRPVEVNCDEVVALCKSYIEDGVAMIDILEFLKTYPATKSKSNGK